MQCQRCRPSSIIVQRSPESAAPTLAPILSLRELALGLLHPVAHRYLGPPTGPALGMVGSDAIGQYKDRKGSHTSPEQLPIRVSVTSELEEELVIMATMRQMIKLSWNEIAVGPWHDRSTADLDAWLQAETQA